MDRFKFHNYLYLCSLLTVLLLTTLPVAHAQFGQQVQWSDDGKATIKAVAGEIVLEAVANPVQRTILATQADLTPTGSSEPLAVRRFSVGANGNKILINTNTKRVWRYDNSGHYWVFNREDKSLTQLGHDLPEHPPTRSQERAV